MFLYYYLESATSVKPAVEKQKSELNKGQKEEGTDFNLLFCMPCKSELSEIRKTQESLNELTVIDSRTENIMEQPVDDKPAENLYSKDVQNLMEAINKCQENEKNPKPTRKPENKKDCWDICK